MLGEDDQEETEDQERSKETSQLSGRSPHVPLKALLGPLPSAASLGLTDTIRECITEDTTNGELTLVTYIYMFTLHHFITCKWCYMYYSLL